MARRKTPRIPDALLDQLLAGADPKTAFDSDGLLDDLKKALAERALNAEMDHHLADDEAGNSRNGYGRKTVTTETGRIELDIPRDRQATFDPQLIAKYQRRFPGFDEKIVSMYARGMSAREIVGHLRDLYGIDVSPDLVSAVTDAVLEEEARSGTKRIAVVAPGFSADCLETLEELAIEGHEQFVEAGGEEFAALSCLNTSDAGLSMLEALLRRELAGWI